MKKTLSLICIALVAAASLFAAPFTLEGSGLKLYDASGKEMALSDASANSMSNGWIITTDREPVMVSTPVGTIKLESGSTLVTGDLNTESPSLYLVDGTASLATEPSFTGTLTLSTTVTKYTIGKDTKVIVESTESNEKVTVIQGSVSALDGITFRKTDVAAMKRYDFPTNTMEEVTAENTPDLSSYQIDQNASVIAPSVPSAPTMKKPVTTLEALTTYKTPSVPQIVSINEVPVSYDVPNAPSSLVVAKTSKETQTTFVITVTPMKPKAPSFKPTVIKVQHVELAPATETKAEPKQAKLTTSVKEPKNSIGVQFKYQFTYHTGSRTIDNELGAYPFFQSQYFTIRLKAFVKTSNFRDYASNLISFDHSSALATIGSVMSYIDGMEAGTKNGPVYFAISDMKNHSEGAILSDPTSLESETTNYYLGFKFGSVRMATSFQDVSFANVSADKYEYGNLSFSYVVDNRSPFVSIGAYYRVKNADTSESFPYIESNIPLVNTRSFRLSLQLGAATYLPIRPKMDSTYIYSDKEFKNYLLSGGFGFGFGDVTISLQANTHKGEVYPFLSNAYSYSASQILTKYDSSMDIKVSARYDHGMFHALALYSQPLTIANGKATRSKLSADSSVGADLLAIDLGMTFGDFAIKGAYEIFGLAEASGFRTFYNGAFTILSGSVVYTMPSKLLSFELGVRKKASQNLYGFALVTCNLKKDF